MFNKVWKKSAATAALSIAILIHAGSASAATTYKAKENDTLWKLSKQFGIQLEELKKFNPNVDPLNIYEGLPIVIPASATNNPNVSSTEAAKKQASNQVMTAKSTVNADSITVGGRDYSVSDVVQAKASAYTAAASENGWGAVDYYGNPLKLGTIAVDPNRIPMGSKVYITGYDHAGLPVGGMMAIATDKGSAIKGDRIDIFIPQSQKQASEFGFQYVKVFILN
ncbi:cell wall-binding protein YocH [Paenibacillus baekrokdamisoli]|uniref:Cell wall-binding protein YocH n=1 Tax=Paenibacillus baekrokdamisoli TaxID=1712516 RepID=A0A3G9J042_9BACL|nr:3D domain-containing protein [Paenibacillus baekrokdamisoli]MBB3073048.1 3D (Asp-Asp-Asp) domain-containing protein [Paenibacillus baekrokdamisoli]BBH21715.1 cell wall-binding protein YocH [Paenibacillus baekrokdamisoli]